MISHSRPGRENAAGGTTAFFLCRRAANEYPQLFYRSSGILPVSLPVFFFGPQAES